MGAVATFNYEKWNAAYPEFSNIDEVRAGIFFTESTLYHCNDGTGLVNDLAQQEMLLGLLTAHIAFLRVGTAGNPSPGSQGIAGRVTNASIGPITASVDLQGLPGTAVWFSQSAYGISYWQATAAYRTMHYRHRHGRNMSGYLPGFPGCR